MSIAKDPPGDEGSLPEGIVEGAVIAGKFRVGPIIGSGAMGTVVLARHLPLDEDVAIKFLLTDRRNKPEGVQRFLSEAKAPLHIQSEHVVRVLDADVLESGVPYIVMEHLSGSDLATRLRLGGPLPVAQAVDFMLQACDALAEAHRLGIVHRDLKPANLFVLEREGAEPMLKVLDFGIAKAPRLVPQTIDAEGTLQSAHSTLDRAILGSPFHMSPEQMESAREADNRSDIWALGVTLFELITGAPPFRGSTLVQVYSAMTSRSGREGEWRSALPAHPKGLDAVIGKCLQIDRERRYATVGELAEALAPFRSRAAAETGSSVGGTVQVAPRRRPRGRLGPGRNLLWATGAGFFGAALFGLVVVLGLRARSSLDLVNDASGPSATAAALGHATIAPEPVPPVVSRQEPHADFPLSRVDAAPAAVALPIDPRAASPRSPIPNAPLGAAHQAPPAAPASAAMQGGEEPAPTAPATASARVPAPASSRFSADEIKRMLDRRE